MHSALRRLVARRRRARAVLRHELVELFLVLGVTQAIEEFLELGLLFLKPPQGLHAVLVEGAVPARGRTEAEAAPLHVVTHPLHFPLHPLHLVLPAILVTPTSHFSAPECVKEKGKTDRPPDDDDEDGHGDPARRPGSVHNMRAIWFCHGTAPSIDISGVGHFPLHDGFTTL